MADSDLISGYLTALRASLRSRPDVDDLVCEVDDHLRSASIRLQARGVDLATAQRQVLERFGDATLVANAFVTTASGGTAMPTRLTRIAGTFALVAAIAWVAVAPAALVGAGATDWEVHYLTLALTAFVASACATVAPFGMGSPTRASQSPPSPMPRLTVRFMSRRPSRPLYRTTAHVSLGDRAAAVRSSF